MEEHHHLLRPLLNPSTTTTSDEPPPLDDNVLNNLNLISSNSGIIFRLCIVALVGTISVWANHEASKGYNITLLNEPNNPRFQLFYVSNEAATRMVIEASNTVENFLYQDPSKSTKKPIKSVIVKLAGHNLTDHVVVGAGSNHDEFIINISPSVMGGTNSEHDMALAVRQGVVRMWLWDGQGNAPKNLINGIIEYLVNILYGSPSLYTNGHATVCWDSNDCGIVAEFLKGAEHRRPGFIRRLNEAMKDGWSDEKLGGLLGLPVHKLCPISEPLRASGS